MNVLFVSNGHGEAAIADRIALELHSLLPDATLDHLALVGDGKAELLHDVGPRRAMPSGGLVAMGNVANIVRDLRAGLIRLTLAQYRFLRAQRGRYAAAVAIGDVYALAMTLLARAPTIFVGTAKSVSVAPYGPLERRVLLRATERFVRDEPTARSLRERGVPTEPAANVIVDLFASPDDPHAAQATIGYAPAIGLFPGSRESAYEDARFLTSVVREASETLPELGAVLSIAPSLGVERFAELARRDGWEVRRRDDAALPFALCLDGREVIRAWRGWLGPILRRVSLVLGQAGTANEAAAAAGVPVVAFDRTGDARTQWYRKRQHGLLGEALAIYTGDARAAAQHVCALLGDDRRRAAMGAIGRERMGEPGAAHRIARRVAQLVVSSR